ncbi:NAD(P)/FAD-dependent oxidoreductase [Dyadobacter luteus]|uniref:NADH:ubiquinone reductase (non-electrogenic) n=1 Tax=Dyadobacter luteus TaxID=2259619 RepID=A0A3D8Y7Q8_9BACT|nr:NAD(P)/FAD-dependent oxidoreductase [Dyadobacter luteus]REA57160.1 NAD(P)/FAD-dependent oxidoreductase [Dyadobacter luteus]
MKIVIIGGGFAGINVARALGNDKRFEIILVDKNNYNFFPPLIYQVATGFLEPSSISYPFRKLFRGLKSVKFRLGYLQRVIPEENKVILSSGELTYDYLIFATGAKTNYFGNENLKHNAIAMKTLDDALEMRNKLLRQMEQASVIEDSYQLTKLLTIVIAGGGPTGVELSGMFAEMRNGILKKEYPELIGKGGDIYLITSASELLSPMSEKSQKDTYDQLRKLGVKIRLQCRVKDFVDDKVVLSNDETISTKNLIWAAGVTGKLFDGLLAESYGRGSRLAVDEYNKVNATENIYAVGDICLQLTDPDFATGHPQVAQVAIQQGRQLAKNFRLMVEGKPLKPFRYTDKGSMAIIGRMKAVADLPKPKMHFNGTIAWFAWLFVHLISLITKKNRFRTLFNWMVAYFTKDQSLRMIFKPSWNKYTDEDKK